MSRFDYVQYDDLAAEAQARAKEVCVALEATIEDVLADGRAKSLALTKLEEVYMWMGKGIRDEQRQRVVHVPLQEQRCNS